VEASNGAFVRSTVASVIHPDKTPNMKMAATNPFADRKTLHGSPLLTESPFAALKKKFFFPSFPLRSVKFPGHHPAAKLKVVSIFAIIKLAALLRVLKRVILSSPFQRSCRTFSHFALSEKSIPKYR
jgi:hypothetical protein